MATTIEWTPELEQRLRKKLEAEYNHADRMVVLASRADKPFEECGIIDTKGSVDNMIKWIKKELGV